MKFGLNLQFIDPMALFIITICGACLYRTNIECFFDSSSIAIFGYWRDFCLLVFFPLSEAEFMVKDSETRSEMPNLLMPVAVVARVILPRKYSVVKCSTDPRDQAGHKESACKKGFLGGLQYLLQLRGNRFATARKDLVVSPVVSAHNSYQKYQLRRFASFDRCPRDRLPPDCRWVCPLVNSGYFFDQAAQTILCFACGRLHPFHAPDCGREHENDTSFPPQPLPVGPDDDVADVGGLNIQVQPSREDLRLQLNNTTSAAIIRVAVPETGSDGGDARVTGLIENQIHGEDAMLHPVMESNRPLSILANRMATYTGDWNGPPVQEMAECGLYQVSSDRAQCFSCKTVFRGLTAEICIWDRHCQLAPSCPHLLHARR